MPSTLGKRRSASTSKSIATTTSPSHSHHDIDPAQSSTFSSLQPHDRNQIGLQPSSSAYPNTNTNSSNINQNSTHDHHPSALNTTQAHPNPRPLACGRRRRHTISDNHIEFMFYHCLRDDIDEEDEDEHDEDEDEDEDSSYHRISTRRQDQQSLFDIHHCDVIVLKTDNGWCFDQDIFLPAWKRDAYEAAGQDDGFSGQEWVKVDEIRVD